MITPDKSLGQNFLFDRPILSQIADYGELTANDDVLEIGPGLGTLTSVLCERAGTVTTVEFDRKLAPQVKININKLRAAGQLAPLDLTKLAVCNEDILTFDLARLPVGYKVIANIPYNITSKIIEKLLTANNPPSLIVLLVQQEVAERIAATPGKLSIRAISTQVYAEVSLGIKVPAGMFTPPPKVDSQVVILRRRSSPLVDPADQAHFFSVVRAGFSEKRKKLRSSLAVGLRTNKTEAEQLLKNAGIDPNKRAQELSIDEWKRLAQL